MRLSGFASILLILSSSVALFAADSAARRPYLALGDSVSFGFIANAGFEYVNPENFIGFPDYVGQTLKLHTRNAACPGETSGSFLSSTAPDDGCRFYRSQVPLHVSYTSTQLDFAVSFLKSHPETRVVSIGLGANDVLLLRTQCADDPTCIALGLPHVLFAVETNLVTILSNLRAAGFKGIIVVVNYYSVDYSDTNETAITAALNQTLAAASAQAGSVVADVFTAFQSAAGPAGGHTCNVGLLNSSPQNQFACDIHPSQSGQKLIARTVEQTYLAARKNAQ
jgi:lysophospholipase L1-like esterase